MSGVPVVDPQILTASWMWAAIDDLSIARHRERLCGRDVEPRRQCWRVRRGRSPAQRFPHGQPLKRQLSDVSPTLVQPSMVGLDVPAGARARVRAPDATGSFLNEKPLKRSLNGKAEREPRVRPVGCVRATPTSRTCAAVLPRERSSIDPRRLRDSSASDKPAVMRSSVPAARSPSSPVPHWRTAGSGSCRHRASVLRSSSPKRAGP